ncbi:hypothetical protein [Rhabdothermincola sp.]|uniref:hypothetical protein n=1 Tax=Rhabdothermincola sp. TaxID=2820405 RepID=UPI002FE160D6
MSRLLRRWRVSPTAAALILLAGVAVVMTHDRVQAAVQSVPSSPVTVTVEPTSEIVDGQRLTINVRTAASHVVYQAEAQVCRPGIGYATSTGPRPAPDFLLGGPNCPKNGLSTSAQSTVSSQFTFKYAPTPEGDTMYLRVGVGVAAWTTNEGEEQLLRCDEANPCVLVVQVRTAPVGEAPVWYPLVFPLTFRDADPVTSCGGAAADVLDTAGSDSLSDAWIAWTKATCNTQGISGAWTRMSFGDEGGAVGRFARGEIDLAYTGVGYDPGAGFAGASTPRQTVAIPIGLNAAVLTVGNGYIDNDGRKQPYGEQRLTAAEMATLLSGGEWAMAPYAAAMKLRNPQLERPDLFPSSTSATKVGGPSEAGATPYFTTRYLDTMAPDAWKVPLVPIPGGAMPGLDRGVHPSLAMADPTFNGSINLLTGRPGIAKIFGSLPPEGGGMWILTDLTTARTFDLPPVALEARPGARVAAANEPRFAPPTPENMRLAASTMVTNPDGVAVPDPNVTDGYPLTYVVYALAPAEPLVGRDGVCRTGAQEVLGKWLSHLIGEGQAQLPEGMEPLTPELRAVAIERLAQVGQAPGPVSCDVPPPPAPSTASGASDGGGTDGMVSSFPSGSFLSGRPRASSTLATLAADGVAAAETEDVTLSSSDRELPGFAGGLLPNGVLAMLGILVLVMLPAAAARLSAGRREEHLDAEWIPGAAGQEVSR